MKKTLILGRKDIINLVSMKDAVSLVEKAFRAYGENRVKMPAKIYLDLPEFGGDFRAMPAYIGTLRACGMKWVCVFPSNGRHNLPTVMAQIILSDPKNGYPLAVLEATHITNLRTGAAGAVAAKHLALKNSRAVALVGCGVQAEFQLLALRETMKIESVKIWGRTRSEAENFAKKFACAGFPVIPCGSVKECVEGSDIICTTTPSRKPLVKFGWIKPGAHINAIGADAPGKEEFDPKILLRAKIVVDDYAQASHSGEINVPFAKGIISKKNIVSDLGSIVAGKKKIARRETDITVFDSTGLAIQDIALADFVYMAALKKKKGTAVELM